MINREVFGLVRQRLAQFDSVALLGPRQVGKTTLARAIGQQSTAAKYLDLENPSDRRLLDDPAAYFSTYSRHLIILDEIHRMPEIFQVLRGQVDERRRMGEGAGKFLILGSASMELMRQSSESLAGRISYVELTPFTAMEVCHPEDVSPENPSAEIDRLWLRGGFPPSFLRDDEGESLQWRADFIQTYLERDLPRFGLQVVTERMELFWRMLANDHGELFNAQRFARSLGVTGHTVTRYLDVLHKLLMVRVLQPWHANTGKRLVKSPRPYIRDSGILHALLNLRTMDDLRAHPVAGKSWEGFVIENLIAATGGRARPYFYRTGAGAEADLILEFSPGRCWAIEVKISSAPKVDRGFYNSTDDIAAERRILVHKGSERFPMRGGVEAMTLIDAIGEVASEVEL